MHREQLTSVKDKEDVKNSLNNLRSSMQDLDDSKSVLAEVHDFSIKAHTFIAIGIQVLDSIPVIRDFINGDRSMKELDFQLSDVRNIAIASAVVMIIGRAIAMKSIERKKEKAVESFAKKVCLKADTKKDFKGMNTKEIINRLSIRLNEEKTELGSK